MDPDPGDLGAENNASLGSLAGYRGPPDGRPEESGTRRWVLNMVGHRGRHNLAMDALRLYLSASPMSHGPRLPGRILGGLAILDDGVDFYARRPQAA